jgi:hypothetical protein
MITARFLLLMSFVFLLASCSNDNGSNSITTPGTSASQAPGSTTPASDKTQVIVFEPPAATSQTIEGGCFAGSVAVQRPNGWRCISGNQIYDPCFGDAGSVQVICVKNPLQPDDAVTMTLSEPLDGSMANEDNENSAWFVETRDGLDCGLLQGATAPVNGERLNYGCGNNVYLIGDLQPGTVWTARQVTVASIPEPSTPVPEQKVELARVWR